MFFKAKDLMTVGNILGGLGTIIIAMEGMSAPKEEAKKWVFWSGFSLLIAYVFDAFDGVVARALKQMNRFGAEFDNVADLVSYSVAPSFLLYFAYRRLAQLPWVSDEIQIMVSVVVSLIPAVFGSIRFARFNVRKLDVPGFWIGFPRPASALMLVSLVNSHLFVSMPVFQWIGCFIVVLLGFMNVSLKPYIGHHGRKFSWYLGTILHIVWSSTLISAIGGIFLHVFPPNVVFDVILMWLTFYLTVQWCDIPSATRAEIAKLTEDWNR